MPGDDADCGDFTFWDGVMLALAFLIPLALLGQNPAIVRQLRSRANGTRNTSLPKRRGQ